MGTALRFAAQADYWAPAVGDTRATTTVTTPVAPPMAGCPIPFGGPSVAVWALLRRASQRRHTLAIPRGACAR